MFTAALFKIVQTWKQPSCHSVGEWINEPSQMQMMEYYPELKKKKSSQALKRHGGTLNISK